MIFVWQFDDKIHSCELQCPPSFLEIQKNVYTGTLYSMIVE